MPPFNGRQLQQQLRASVTYNDVFAISMSTATSTTSSTTTTSQRPRRRHNMWVRPWLLQREERGAYHNIMAELCATDIPGFTNYTRMTPEFFEMIKTRLEPRPSQAGHQLQSSNQCGEEVSPHHQISGHRRLIHIIILSVQGWQIHHFQVSTRGLQGHPG